MNFSNLFFNGWKYALVNGITLSRILICPVILWLLFANCQLPIANLLLAAFLTDALDGFLARKLKVISEQGTKLDSFADDCLFITCCIVIFFLHNPVVFANLFLLGCLVFILTIKLLMLWIIRKKIFSGLHTWLSKSAAFFQAVFFIHSMFFQPSQNLFFIAFILTFTAIFEEIIIITRFPDIKSNFKGLLFDYFHPMNPKI